MFTISPISSINTPVNTNVTVQATPGVNLIAAVIPPLVVLVLITVVVIPVITTCLCRKRGEEQSVYYSEVGLPQRNNTLKRDAEPQYWTIADIKESQTKPPILHSADDTDSQQRPTCDETEANHNYHAVQEHTTFATAITVSLAEDQACGTGIAQRVSSNNEITTKPTHGADIATEDVETDANIAYSCNDETFAVTDNPAYSTDISIALDVSTQENVAYSITPSQSVCDDDVANITGPGSHGDSYGGETATMIPLTDIHPAHCTSAGIAPENSNTTFATAITVPLMENQECGTGIAQRVSSNNEITTKPTHGAGIATEGVEDIAIAPDVSTQENVAYNNIITPSQSVCDDDVAELPPLPPRNRTLKRDTEPQYWTIADIKESQTKPPILHSADTDFQQRPTCDETEANHNYHAVQEHTTFATAITVPLMEDQACGTDIAQRVSSNNEITTKPTHGADIATEDVETDANIAYSCNDETFAVTDNPAYSTDISIALDVSTQENVTYNITPSQSVCDD